MEILKHYIVLKQYTGLLINSKKQGIHFIDQYSIYEFLNYLDDKEEGLCVGFLKITKAIRAIFYNKNNEIWGKGLYWFSKKLDSCINYSNGRRNGMCYIWYNGYLESIELHNSFKI